jgi:hypothetical protein
VTTELRVYRRDASAYDFPETSSTKVHHWPHPTRDGWSACGRSVLDIGPLSYDDRSGFGSGSPPDSVSAEGRCMRSGCRARWVAYKHQTQEQTDGSVTCSCGEHSPRFGTRACALEWIRDHRRTP